MERDQQKRYRFGAPARAGWHRHHLLPNHLQKFPDLRDFMLSMAEGGVALEDFATNGMYLPAEEALACKAKLPLHRGSHRTYNEIVIEAVNSIRLGLTVARIGLQGRMAAIRGLQSDLRQRLRDSTLTGPVSLAG